MNKLLPFIITFCSFPVVMSAQYTLLWQNSQNVSKSVKCVAVDNSGNTIISGSFSSSLNIGTTVLTSANNSTAGFIAKMDAAGNWLWAAGNTAVTGKKTASTSYVQINDLETDGSGNVYIAGYFRGSVNFGSTTLTQNGNSTYAGDLFVAKMSSSGTFTWAKKEGGIYADGGNALSVDGSGSVYVTGWYTRSAGNGNNAFTLPDLYVVKYNNSGTKQWEKKYAVNNSPGNELVGNDIAIDNTGSICIAGRYKGNASLGTNMAVSSAIPSALLCKLSSTNGTAAWVRTATGSGESVARSLILDNSNEIYLAGSWSSSPISFGSLALPSPIPYSSNWGGSTFTADDNGFIVKYSESGNPLWISHAIPTGMGNTETIKLFKYPGNNIGLYTEAHDGLYLKSFDPASGVELSSLISSGFTWEDYWNDNSLLTAGGIAAGGSGFAFTMNGSGSFTVGNLTITSGQPYSNNTPVDMHLIRYTAPQERLTNFAQSSFSEVPVLATYPNPVKDFLRIASKDGSRIGRISVWDQSGKRVADNTIDSDKGKIDLGSLPPGVYILTGETQKLIARIIKE